MAERFVKIENGKQVVYEPGGWLGPDRRVGVIEKSSIFDPHIKTSHVFVPEGPFGGPLEEARVEGTRVLPLRPAKFVIPDGKGGTTSLEDDSWQGRYVSKSIDRATEEHPKKSPGKSGGAAYRRTSGNSSSSTGVASIQATQGNGPPVLTKKGKESKEERISDGAAAVVGVVCVFGLFALAHSLSKPKEEHPPPSIPLDRWLLGFLSVLGLVASIGFIFQCFGPPSGLPISATLKGLLSAVIAVPSIWYLQNAIRLTKAEYDAWEVVDIEIGKKATERINKILTGEIDWREEQ